MSYPAGCTISDIDASCNGDGEPFDAVCPNCGVESKFTEHHASSTETHGLDCGPYETFEEAWLTCNRCSARTDDGELRLKLKLDCGCIGSFSNARTSAGMLVCEDHLAHPAQLPDFADLQARRRFIQGLVDGLGELSK